MQLQGINFRCLKRDLTEEGVHFHFWKSRGGGGWGAVKGIN